MRFYAKILVCNFELAKCASPLTINILMVSFINKFEQLNFQLTISVIFILSLLLDMVILYEKSH